ncbi:MAG: hypothetical protein ACRDE6_04225, partial [Candidatus Limnocylindria bacterium]
VHRIGRTGRAGIDGVAISLVSPQEMPQLADIEHLLGRAIPREPLPVDAASLIPRGERPPHDGRRAHRSTGGRRPAGRSSGWSGLPGERRANIGVGGG